MPRGGGRGERKERSNDFDLIHVCVYNVYVKIKEIIN